MFYLKTISNHPHLRYALLGSLGLLLMLAGAGQSEEALSRVSVFETAKIYGDEVRLGKIAKIQATNAVMQTALQDIVIAAAPLPGQTRSLLESHITLRLRQNNIDPASLVLSVPSKVDITRAFAEISIDQIQQLLQAYVEANVPWDAQRVSISDLRISDAVVLPTGAMTCEIIPPARTRWLGNVPFTMVFMVDGRPEKRIMATVRIQMDTDVVFTQRPLRRFQVITAEDLYYRQMDMANLPSNALMEMDAAVGMRTQRTLDANVLLRHDLVEAPPLVNRRDVVRILYESGRVHVSTLGEVRETGRQGDRIRVANLSSGKEILARVVDSETVIVDR